MSWDGLCTLRIGAGEVSDDFLEKILNNCKSQPNARWERRALEACRHRRPMHRSAAQLFLWVEGQCVHLVRDWVLPMAEPFVSRRYHVFEHRKHVCFQVPASVSTYLEHLRGRSGDQCQLYKFFKTFSLKDVSSFLTTPCTDIQTTPTLPFTL